VAVYWDQCHTQVLCHYTGILFDELIAGSEDNFIKNQFSSADSDQDGRVYFEELLDKIEEDVRIMFGVLDTNYDKSISDEIQSGLIVPRHSLEFIETAVHVYFTSLYNMDIKEERIIEKWNTRENVLDFIKRMFFLIDTNTDGLVMRRKLIHS